MQTTHLCAMIHISIKGEVGNVNMFKPSSILLVTVPRRRFFCEFFFFNYRFHVCLYYYVLSDLCSRVITCWESDDLLALLCVMLSCVFVTYSYGVSGQWWHLIVLIPDHTIPSSLLWLGNRIQTFFCADFDTLYIVCKESHWYNLCISKRFKISLIAN